MTIVKSEVCFISGELDLVGIEKGQNSYLPLSVQTLSRVRLFATHGLQHARLPCPSPTPRACSNSYPSGKWCHPTISSFPSIRVFSNESVLHIRWPKNWSLSFSVSPFKEYSGLIALRIDWFDLFAVHGTFKSLLQHHSSKASILQCSTFFIVKLSHPYMTPGKTIVWLDGPLLAR